jgi:acetylornithine/succinyldiaminopimelate/putrescine aminotransferase/predicted amino acid dehydrogenase
MLYPRRDLLNPTLAKIFKTFKLDKDYTSGKGSYLMDSNGIHYLDFIAQYGAIPFGYNPDFIWDKLDEARRRNLPSLVQPSIPGEALKLANIIAGCTPGDLCYCTFCQSGTEAVEAAIKLARSNTGRELIVSTENSFHGKTLASLSATGKDSYQIPFRAPAPGFLRIPFNDLEILKKTFAQYNDNIAGFIVEPVQGEGGIITADPGYLPAVQKLCNEYGIVFIVDEIQTGLGRTGALFACDHEKVEPDVMLLAKALGGGMVPLGVCISSPEVWNEDFAMLHSSTFANNNITCAVGISVLEKLGENNQEIIKEVGRKGEYLFQQVTRLAENYPTVIKEVRGKGLMVGLEFHNLDDCGAYDMAYLVNQGGFTILLTGFLLNVYHIRLAPYLNNSMTLRLEPTLTISCEEIDNVIDAIEDICKILKYRDYSKLYRYLLGDNSKPKDIIDFRPVSRRIKFSHLKNKEEPDYKFAFIIHYPGPEDIILNNPSFASYSRDELFEFLKWESSVSDPGIVCHMPAVKSKSGSIVEGWLIGVPFGGKEIMSLPREEVVDTIKKAVDLGKDLGAQIVGLGALTSVVTRGGRSVTGRNVAITSGNSFTTLMAVEALFLGAQKMKIDLKKAVGGVVGATGSIGRACALMLSEKIDQIILFGNPRHIKSSKNRLNSLASDIYAYARQRMQNGDIKGMSSWINKIIDLLVKDNSIRANNYLNSIMENDILNPELINEVCEYLDIKYPIEISIDINNDLPVCNLIIATSNSPEYLIYPENIQPGAVVCDVARPADVSPEVIAQRADVLVLEGGLVQLPDDISFGPNLGYRDGVNLACLSETILLDLEGDFQDYSIGNHLSLETVQYLRGLATKHGFQLAGLKMGNKELDDKDIARIYMNSINFKMVENI